jgi:pimeloyl-ACP methyl ester carboxylesterase
LAEHGTQAPLDAKPAAALDGGPGMARLAVETRRIRAQDGTTLAVHDTGGNARPLVIANGLGGPFAAWCHQVEYLRDRYRILSWDYRGLYGSSRPPGSPPRLDVPAHVADLVTILDELGIEQTALMGWSMGVQVGLELYARHPERLSHLVLINGTYGKALQSIAIPLATRVAPAIVRHTARFRDMGSAFIKRATGWPETALWLKRLGLVAETTDDELFGELAMDFGSVDLDVYLDTLRQLEEHDASHILDSVAVPTLVLVGERDIFTAHKVAEKLALRIPNSEMLMIRGGTHYVVLEQPELVNLRIEKFFREHGY